MTNNMSKQEKLIKTLADSGVMMSRLYLEETKYDKHPICLANGVFLCIYLPGPAVSEPSPTNPRR